MRIGPRDIKYCNECPAFDWAGESLTEGDLGFYCQFSNNKWKHYHGLNIAIPNDCPLRLLDKKQLYIKAYGGG